ncbi:MAG TPA: VOC family protein [Propionibacteriaceae bacterium]
MIQPVTYVEINSPDLPRTRTFMEEVFDWHLEPFAAADYLVAAAGDGGGVDSGLMPSQDGNPRTIPVIRVDDLEASLAAVVACGGKVVVPAFSISGVGRGCYITDPVGLLIGLHHYDPGTP